MVNVLPWPTLLGVETGAPRVGAVTAVPSMVKVAFEVSLPLPLETRTRACEVTAPPTVQDAMPSLAVEANRVSQLEPLSRESSMVTAPPLPIDQVMSWALPSVQRSPPLGAVSVGATAAAAIVYALRHTLALSAP